MSDPLVSVIIPTYNRERFIADALTSVVDQTYRNTEIIVVDDGSTDDTEKEVHRFHSSRLHYKFQPNAGVSAALNTGLQMAQGHYIARLDSDDMFLPQKLERQVEKMKQDPDIGMIYTQAYNISNEGRVLGIYPQNHQLPEEPLKALRSSLFPPSQSILFRSDCLKKIGEFDESLPIAEDYDFCIRMAAHYRLGYIDEPLVKIRKHTEMVTGDRLLSARCIVRVLERYRDMLSAGEGYQWLSPHYYKLARQLFADGDNIEARKSFYQAIGYDRLNFAGWSFFVLSFLPPWLITRMKRSYWKKI